MDLSDLLQIPAYLLTCTTPAEKPEIPTLLERTAEDIQAWAWEHVTEEQVRKVTDHRQVECDLRRQYLNTTFTDLILDLQNKLNELHQEQLFGTDTGGNRIERLRQVRSASLGTPY